MCGIDGKIYDNDCMMEILLCNENKIVFVDYDGKCEKDFENCKY